MTGPLDKPPYLPTAPANGEPTTWAYREFRTIAQLLAKPPGWYLNESNIAPTRPRTGLLAYADGTNWDPGSGPGLYVYTGSSWAHIVGGGHTKAWANYTPTVTAATGTITTASATGRWYRLENVVTFNATINITTNGTGAGTVRATLPVTAAGATSIVAGRENLLTGKMCQGVIANLGTFVDIVYYDNTYPGANGAQIFISGTYEGG